MLLFYLIFLIIYSISLLKYDFPKDTYIQTHFINEWNILGLAKIIAQKVYCFPWFWTVLMKCVCLPDNPSGYVFSDTSLPGLHASSFCSLNNCFHLLYIYLISFPFPLLESEFLVAGTILLVFVSSKSSKVFDTYQVLKNCPLDEGTVLGY